MPRAIWSGSIAFGLVNAPVKMYSAIDEHDLELHLVHEKDGSRIGYEKVCKKEGKEVPADEIVKAYEAEEGEYVYLTEDDFRAAEEEGYRTIEVLDFVPRDEIDPIVFKRTYYLGPGTGAEKVYAVLVKAMESSGLSAVARYVFHDKQQLGTLRVRDGVITLENMYFADEIRPTKGVVPDKLPTRREARARDGGEPHRALHVVVRARPVRGRVPKAPPAGRAQETEGRGDPRRAGRGGCRSDRPLRSPARERRGGEGIEDESIEAAQDVNAPFPSPAEVAQPVALSTERPSPSVEPIEPRAHGGQLPLRLLALTRGDFLGARRLGQALLRGAELVAQRRLAPSAFLLLRPGASRVVLSRPTLASGGRRHPGEGIEPGRLHLGAKGASGEGGAVFVGGDGIAKERAQPPTHRLAGSIQVSEGNLGQ